MSLWNSSRFHYLEPLIKGIIAKMAYLAEIWLILESDLVEHAPQKIFVESIWNCYIAYYRLYSNQHILFHRFGYVMKKLWHFYPKHLFLTSLRTSHKPYFPWSVNPKIHQPTRWFFYNKYLDMFPQWPINIIVWIILEKKLLWK